MKILSMLIAVGVSSLSSVAAAVEPGSALALSTSELASNKAGNGIVSMTPELVVELRRRLYDHGYPIRHFDADVGQDLQQSIALLKRHFGEPPGEGLSVDLIERLRQLSPPNEWGALGYSGTGGHVGVTHRPNRSSAESESIAECSSKAHKRCRALAVSGKQCVILVHSIHSDGFRPVVQNFIAFGSDPDALKARALADCKAGAQIRDNCTVRRVVCADGR